MDHIFASVQKHPLFGLGVYATGPIKAGEEIASFDGEMYHGLVNDDFPEEIRNFLITYSQNSSRDSAGIARYLNHSCAPNVGVRGLFTLVAMREIKIGEELCWDYDMSEDIDWQMDCSCGSPECRRSIRGFRFLPEDVREKYRGFISDWLVEKYHLKKD